MARYDKYTGINGGFRAHANADQVEGDYNTVLGASINASGLAVLKAAGQTGYVGVCIVDATKRKAGDVLDIMTSGEIVDVAGLAAGTAYYLTSGGALTATAPGAGVNGYYVGHTVEATRLVVRFQKVQG